MSKLLKMIFSRDKNTYETPQIKPALAKDYRKDIDGLRALAVLLVIFYHVGSKLVQAGFVGVDIFFVISGFLITSHICRDIEKGSFSIKQFYMRRMRRILPALIVVLFFTTVAAYFFLAPPDLKNYSHSLIATILSISNFYFLNFIHIGYFSTDARVIPLLHTWSLGVEEQFYLVWPFLLILLFKIFPNRKHILSTIVLLCFCSFLAYYFLRENVQLVYYSPMTRGFELFLGAILAFKYHQLTPIKSKLLLHLFSIIGLGLIIYAGCILTPRDYPGLNSLLPTLGAVVLIYTGKNDGFANKILSLSPLVFIGLISYSLYLWHWPMIAFVNYFGIPLNFIIQVCIIVSSVILSFLTWKFVEQPFRQKFKFNFKKTFALTWAVPFLAAIIFFVPTKFISNFGFNRMPHQALKAISNKYFGSLNPKGYCHNLGGSSSRLGPQDACSIGNTTLGKTQVLLTGDSHAMAANGMISVFLKNADLKGYIATQAGTPFVLTNPEEPDMLIPSVVLRDTIIEKLIKQQHYKYVVMGGDWSFPIYQFKTKKIKNSLDGFKFVLKNAVKFIIKNKSIPVILLDIPPLGHVPVTCGLSRISFDKCFNSIAQVKKEQAQRRQVILDIKKKYPQVILIDPSRIICQNGKCYSSINGTPLYFTGGNNSHLNYAGSTLIGKLYLKKYGNPFGNHYHFHAESYLKAPT